MQYRAPEFRQYLSIMTLYNLFTNRIGINTSPDTIRPHPDTQRHSPDTPRQKRFYVIRGTCPQYSALYYIKMPMSEGVWMVSEWCLGRLDGVCGCLDGVCGCLNDVCVVSEGVWGGINTKSVGKNYVKL